MEIIYAGITGLKLLKAIAKTMMQPAAATLLNFTGVAPINVR
jgi:hypothetical protein